MEQTCAERKERESENVEKKEKIEKLKSENELLAGGNGELLNAIEVW